MAFKKLTLKSKQLLDEMLAAENPSAMLSKHFDDISSKEDAELRGIIRELRELGYIDVKWADNVPYCVIINNSARTYSEQLEEHEKERNQDNLKSSNNSKIFISHRSSDCSIADALFDFFVATGISRDKIFCSSLPGNNVKEKISVEVRETMKNSCLNIAILSTEYYQSAYCLNEAGILWFQDIPIIPIALPEIQPTDMIGFLNDDYKIRRLDNADDLAYIYDTACAASTSNQAKASVVTAETRKLILKYQQLLSSRTYRFLQSSNSNPEIVWGINTYKIGDPVLFNESDRFAPLIYNNMKGRIKDIEPTENKIRFDVELDIAITDWEAEDYDFTLVGTSDNGNSIISFWVDKYLSTDDDTDSSDAIVPFQVAYAVSIHKAQGLEYKSVKIVITNEVEELITHNIFYTAITRAKEDLKIYWTPETEKKILEGLSLRNYKKDAALLAAMQSL